MTTATLPPRVVTRMLEDDSGDIWPLQPAQTVLVLDRAGRITERATVRSCRSGELIEAEVGGCTVRGRVV
jgi:hypothetical protein